VITRVAGLALLAAVAGAQAQPSGSSTAPPALAAFTGFVLDSAKQPIVDAEVSLPRLGLTSRTNERGQFLVQDVPPGTHEISVRHLGYGLVEGRVSFAAGSVVARKVTLARIASLDAIAVTERVVIQSFEDHRRIGQGHFLTRADIASHENQTLASLLTNTPGLHVMYGSGPHAWITTTRGSDARQPDVVSRRLGAKRGCFANVYLDAILIYSGRRNEPLFDINTIAPSTIEAIEYFANAPETPSEYNSAMARCGVLIIHTRRTY
jgi:hypothetical protein